MVPSCKSFQYIGIYIIKDKVNLMQCYLVHNEISRILTWNDQ